jgi:tRNA U34 5-carboxymethylaminomethyl modifying enzyme MnmG/GidA
VKVRLAIVGAGLTGCELALQLAARGVEALLITPDSATIARQHDHKPAILPLDSRLVQFPLMDRSGAARAAISATPAITLLEDWVCGLDPGPPIALHTRSGQVIQAEQAVLAVGSFLGAVLHQDGEHRSQGREGEPSDDQLLLRLSALGVPLERHHASRPAGPSWHAYLVEYWRIKPAGLDGYRVRAVPGLWAAGACRGAERYWDAVDEGRELAELLASSRELA